MSKIRLTESQLHEIIKESVINILSESSWGGKNVSSYHVDDEDDYCGTRIGDPKDNEYYQRQFDSISESDNYKGQTNGWWGPDPNYTRKSGKATPKPSSSDWQEQYCDNRGYKFSSKGSGANKQLKREKVSEAQLHRIVENVVNEAYYERKPNGQTIVHRDKQYFGGIPQQQQQTQQQQPNPKQILSQPPKCNNGYTIRDLHNTLGEERCQTLGGVAQYFKSCAKYGSVGNNSQFFRIFVNNENLNNALAAGAITQQERNIIVRIYNQDVAPYASANQQRSIEDLAKEVKRGYRVNLSSSEANRLINSGLVSPRDVAWAMGWRPEQGEEALKNYMPSF